MNTFYHFPRKLHQFLQSNICQKLKYAIFKRVHYSFLSSSKLQNRFLRRFQSPNFDLSNFLCFTSLFQKMFSTSLLKNCEKLKTDLSKCSEHSFFILRSPLNYFLKGFFWPTLNLNGLEGSASLYKKTVSTSLLKNFQKMKQSHFQRFRTFVFEVKLASKPFSEILPMTNFEFKRSWKLCNAFLENSFNFATQNFAKNVWKMPLSNAQNIRFRAQGSLKTISKNVSYDQLWI